MDDRRFDRLTKTMARGKSRRNMMKTLFGVAAGGAVAEIAVGNASAAGRAAGATCRTNGECISGTCAVAADGRRRCCYQECYNCGLYNTETCCDNLCTS